MNVVDVVNRKTGRVVKKVCVDFDFDEGVIKQKTLGICMLKHITAVPPTRPNDSTHTTTMEVDGPPSVNENATADNNNNNNNNETNSQSAMSTSTLLSTDNNEQPVVPATVQLMSPLQPRAVSFREVSSPSGRPQRNATMVASVNDTNWYHEPNVTLFDINGPVRYREWGVRTPTGDVLYPGNNSDERYSRMDIFMLMFPPRQLDHMLKATNDQLEIRQKRKTTKQELLKFFGIIILCTKYEFTSRSSLWSTDPISKYELPPTFGRTGMGRVRFDELWTSVRFSYQPPTRPEDVSSEAYRWSLVDGFVSRFNNHRASTFIPSEFICVDEGDGMGKAVTGSITACPCMWQSIESQKTVARYRTQPVVKAE